MQKQKNQSRLCFRSTWSVERFHGSKTALILCLTVLLTFPGCPGTSPKPSRSTSEDSAKLNIVVTTGIVGDLVRHVAGEHAQVTALMGEGVDPHLYRPTAKDTGTMMNADLIIYSGLMLEGPMQPAFEQAARKGKAIDSATAGLATSKIRYPDGFDSHPDPHVWGDVQVWMSCLERVVETLCKLMPEHSEDFRNNANAYLTQLTDLDQYAREAIATIPQEHRFLVTAHDAFEYFSAAYEIEVRSVQGITTESDPGVQDINELVRFLVEHKVPAIFVEATVNAGNIQAVIEGSGRQGWDVKIGGTLYSDSLGTPGSYEGTYIGMMDSNITTIVRALGGQAPERGFQGRLSKPVP